MSKKKLFWVKSPHDDEFLYSDDYGDYGGYRVSWPSTRQREGHNRRERIYISIYGEV